MNILHIVVTVAAFAAGPALAQSTDGGSTGGATPTEGSVPTDNTMDDDDAALPTNSEAPASDNEASQDTAIIAPAGESDAEDDNTSEEATPSGGIVPGQSEE